MDPCPLTRQQVLDYYFLEHRAKLLDIAACLDRLDRASGTADFRDAALRQAAAILTDGKGERAKRMLLLWSDHSSEVPQDAAGQKGAVGACEANLTGEDRS